MNYGDVSSGRTGRDGLDMQLKEQPEQYLHGATEDVQMKADHVSWPSCPPFLNLSIAQMIGGVAGGMLPPRSILPAKLTLGEQSEEIFNFRTHKAEPENDLFFKQCKNSRRCDRDAHQPSLFSERTTLVRHLINGFDQVPNNIL